MTRNLGETGLCTRRRSHDPMAEYDALPQPIRRWLAGAVLPWSPASCRRIWMMARARGESLEVVLTRLARAEMATLERAVTIAGSGRQAGRRSGNARNAAR